MIVSFQKTVEAIRHEIKTVTRRKWKRLHADWFYAGREFEAWTAGPHRGGVLICKLVVTVKPYPERLGDITQEHFEREGGTMYWTDRQAYIDMMGGPDDILTVLEFDYTEEIS